MSSVFKKPPPEPPQRYAPPASPAPEEKPTWNLTRINLWLALGLMVGLVVFGGPLMWSTCSRAGFSSFPCGVIWLAVVFGFGLGFPVVVIFANVRSVVGPRKWFWYWVATLGDLTILALPPIWLYFAALAGTVLRVEYVAALLVAVFLISGLIRVFKGYWWGPTKTLVILLLALGVVVSWIRWMSGD